MCVNLSQLFGVKRIMFDYGCLCVRVCICASVTMAALIMVIYLKIACQKVLMHLNGLL